MDWISQPEAWIALATLTVLEVILGIDNIIFISILSEKVRADQRARLGGWGLRSPCSRASPCFSRSSG